VHLNTQYKGKKCYYPHFTDSRLRHGHNKQFVQNYTGNLSWNRERISQIYISFFLTELRGNTSTIRTAETPVSRSDRHCISSYCPTWFLKRHLELRKFFFVSEGHNWMLCITSLGLHTSTLHHMLLHSPPTKHLQIWCYLPSSQQY